MIGSLLDGRASTGAQGGVLLAVVGDHMFSLASINIREEGEHLLIFIVCAVLIYSTIVRKYKECLDVRIHTQTVLTFWDIFAPIGTEAATAVAEQLQK